ncbi:MAG TPA: S-adenosylmethionine:tRNA ribosyltransferase-isomerase [Bacteroidales bacterium]|nr:S-adenosylmethionine:tRNA ribosyltransferase-isomerase [Bacteroidales bacterium]
MISIKDIKPSEYSYELPAEKIASFPVSGRDQSRLLIYDAEGILKEDIFKNISGYLPVGSNIFFNNSRVIPARLIFVTPTGGKVELFCLKPIDPPDYQGALSSKSQCSWECMIGNVKRFKAQKLNLKVDIIKDRLILSAERAGKKGNTDNITFSWDNDNVSFAEIISAAGKTPLPPYIKRDPLPEDRDRYQTIYSKIEGSVAAPTAGLHFTNDVLNTLFQKNIKLNEITLHVGAGTFQPVKAAFVTGHKMHAEYFEITSKLVHELAQLRERVTCVGTTTVRTLESIYWIGAKLAMYAEVPDSLHLNQWEPYSLNDCRTTEAFNALVKWFEIKKTEKTFASTSLMIVPGYRFKMTERLITNFHQPGSSLLMLIAAFIGDPWRHVYQYAMDNGFRFLSYGDSSLLFNPNGA